ncbi:MAG: c-type cytochrome [Gemmataceae bacterium]|nr:c-type cytochrome [Gemmataceae bacterium]
MSKALKCLAATGFAAILGLPVVLQLHAQLPNKSAAVSDWIWLAGAAQPDQTVYFRKEIILKHRITSAKLFATCDNRMTVYVNGKEALASDNWQTPVFREVTDLLRAPRKGDGPMRNVIAVKAQNSDGPAGLVLRLELEAPKKQTTIVGTDGSWRATDKSATGWNEVNHNDASWTPAAVVAKLGHGPWKITETALAGGGKFRKPTATPVELIKVKKDFKVELLYSVPKATQGSWVNMCVDPKGRLITSDQNGRLYRCTPPKIGGNADDTTVEMLPVELGGAHGLLWAFDSLYVVVCDGKYTHGLWRVRSSNNDDMLDTKELLRPLAGGGEHGPHAVILSPDGKSLYVCCGNHTKLTDLAGGSVPPIWKEDYLVPRMWDASGHAKGILAPGGHIYKVDPDGKNWQIESIGYRNQFDAAFNRDGELFTYDSDMEWFMNLPFYRPTRMMHAVPGSDFGWRSGSATKPVYYPDNLPSAVDIGPGSPCGVAFGYGARFPAKYQEAFFGCDWSYGKLYAVHFKPHGASYVGEAEEFMNGSPLPLTDVVINPNDGAMYFTIGGRGTMSGLYRITYVGNEATEPRKVEPAPNPLRDVRRKLEGHFKKDANAVAIAWPHLNHADRHIRWAARTVLEFQDPDTWRDKALAEPDPVALTNALIGLVRVGDKDQGAILEALERVDFRKLTVPQQLDYLRAYQLAFSRGAAPTAVWKERVGKRLDAWYPAAVREVNAELSRLIAYLEVPGGVAKTLALLAKAPTQEEQIDYVMSLRIVKPGWTIPQREQYLNWFHKAANYRGHHSFNKFMYNIRAEAIESMSKAERAALEAAIDNVPQPAAPTFTFKQRPFVKKWGVDELVPEVEQKLAGRNFDRGRNLFGETKCFACHRFNNEGGGTGPDLTQVVGRFGPRDLLEAIIDPNKVISDQYAAIDVITADGRRVSGRIVNLHGDNISINTDMLDPNKNVNVNRNLIDTIVPSKISMMPGGLIDTLTRDEILDLVAYLYSRGDRGAKMFRKD